ncbi:MAG: tetratricopeptide repeat protein [Acetobacteraceae bacterium]|nr:tetratricopeptide repeat protein [Acetobacteraceae bacterium]
MYQDVRGLDVTAASEAAVRACDHVIEGFTGYRADLQQRMEALFVLDPDCGMAHCLRGYFTLMSFKQAALPVARTASEEAWRLTTHGTERERAHAAALDAWVDGEPDRAVEVWDQILAAHPRDLLAFRLAHFVNFWLGRPDAMLVSVLAVQPHWSDADAGYPSLLACRCFAHEECGSYTEAEAAGRDAIRRDPGDPWAAHGVAHVLEMQGRRSEGIAWIEALQPNWADRNNLRHHLSWHAALYHLERGDTAGVLTLYDTGFRDLASPLTQAMPDLYIDVQNAASMLFRLGRHGVDVGNRWEELADKAEARIGDCLSGFTLPHWMMALAATGREAAARRMLEAMRAFAHGSENAERWAVRLTAEVALPVTEAVLAHGQGRHAAAVALMRPVLGEMYRLGGSHAQQDVLEQLYLDAALKAGLTEDARMLMERVAGRHTLPPSRRRGYAMAAGLLT